MSPASFPVGARFSFDENSSPDSSSNALRLLFYWRAVHGTTHSERSATVAGGSGRNAGIYRARHQRSVGQSTPKSARGVVATAGQTPAASRKASRANTLARGARRLRSRKIPIRQRRGRGRAGLLVAAEARRGKIPGRSLLPLARRPVRRGE